MVKRIQINMSNKLFYSLIVFGVLILLGIGVYAYGSSNPSVMGHSAGEIEIDDAFCNQIIGHDCGVDNVGDVGGSVVKVNYEDCVFVNHCYPTQYKVSCPVDKIIVAHALYGSVGDDGCGTEWIKCCSLKIE